ncbi:MAG: NifB/NifX family molybdenum-iron cluster-binding protein [Deltaproteobacteria bacterium]|nr:NifB/NifX family molybdenum-iron cluster-binding protein [Deltaproteobacteria bacterium]
MRIAFSAESNEGLNAQISQHFGRCPFYVIVDLEGEDIKGVDVIENPFYTSHGAPGEVPGFINQQGVKVMITGGMGGRAIQFFQQFGIEPITGATGTVSEALDLYISGRLKGFSTCND